jgi:probable HAF family extracellular repeat protein
MTIRRWITSRRLVLLIGAAWVLLLVPWLNGITDDLVGKAYASLTDSDGDGLPDDWEIANGLDPNNATGDNGPDGDPDGDGSHTVFEYLGGTDPQSATSVPRSPITRFSYTQIDYPGATSTWVSGINNAGAVAGSYQLEVGGASHGWVWSGGIFSTVDCAGASSTEVTGINNVGSVVGITVNASGVATGFVRELAGPTCVPVSVPGAISTWPADINDAGQVVGHFVDPASVQHGFVWAAGVYTVLDVPGASWTIADGINEAGRVVGISGTEREHSALS